MLNRLTGHTRLRLGKSKGKDVLILQVEEVVWVTDYCPALGAETKEVTLWRDAKVEDL